MNLDTLMRKDLDRELADIKQRVARIEHALKDPEGELSAKSKRQLERSKARPRSEFVKL